MTTYINNLPKNKYGEILSEYELAILGTSLFNKKNINDIDIISELRLWFTTIKQPTKNIVDKAMILIIDNDYAIKHCGESKSDSIYCSSLKWLQANPKTGLDYEPIIFKKWSTNFNDVLITFKDIENIFETTLTNAEKNLKLINTTRSLIGELFRNYKINKHTNVNCPSDKILLFLKNVPKNIKLEQYQLILDKKEKDYNWFNKSESCILDKNNKPCIIESKKYVENLYNELVILKNIKPLIL
jgi:hypothetical protein